MNYNFYLLGTPNSVYRQYPDDYSAELFKTWQSELKAAQMVIHRDGDIMHYVYSEHINPREYIGFALVFNDGYLAHPQLLAMHLHTLIHEELIHDGEMIAYTNSGELQYIKTALSKTQLFYQRVNTRISKELESGRIEYQIEKLPTTYNGSKTTGFADGNSSEESIIALTEKHNTVLINLSGTLVEGYVERTMNELRKTNQQLSEDVNTLKDEVILLNRKKKQFKWVITLCVLLLAAMGFLLTLNRNLNETKSSLDDAYTTIDKHETSLSTQQKLIKNMKDTIESTRQDLDVAYDDIRSLQQQNQNLQNELSTLQQQFRQLQKDRDYYYQYWWTH